MLHKRLFIMIFIIISLNLAAQDKSAENTADLLKPVYPSGSTGLIYIEGEDAVSTNFANQAVSNFGSSGYRAVQLSRNTGLQGGAPFFAEFVFYVEEAGVYEFWYGGTPPGPADELSPSYASPFSISLDGDDPIEVFREDIHVIEDYSPSYYWNKCNSFDLSEGSHRLRIEISKKRGYDGRYFFYLDSLFFLNRDKIDELDDLKPEVFPTVLESSAIDNPFLSINDYQNYINSNPDEISAYIELSLVYSLLGDYQSALKTLSKAMALDSTDPYPIILAAKNRLWKGDVRESLTLYERALGVNPDDRILWTEAGKVAAWSAEYDRSIDFFRRGLEKFPDDLNMMVNLGLTYIWMARDADAEDSFNAALKAASGDPKLLSKLGWIEEAVGYPEYARDVYLKSIELYPSYLEFYLMLQSSYLSSGDREAADGVGRRIESTFRSSDRLQNELEVYQAKLNLRDEVIEAYLQKLREDPGNLELRQELAQTFFWNGMRTEAIEQIRYVITTYSYRAAETFIRRNSDLFELVDTTAGLGPLFDNFSVFASEVKKNITASAAVLKKAVKTSDSADAETAGSAKEAVRAAEQSLADAVEAARSLERLIDDAASVYEINNEKSAQILSEEKDADEAFRAVIASSGWFWDKDWQISELTDVLSTERELASFMLSRVYISDKQFVRAAEVLMPPADTEIIEQTEPVFDFSKIEPAPLYSLYQALLLGGDTGSEADPSPRAQLIEDEFERLTPVFPYLSVVEQQLAVALQPFASVSAGIYYEGLQAELAEILNTLDDGIEAAAAKKKELNVLGAKLAAVMAKRLERINYYLEADTYLIRYELGNYYLDEGMNLEASEQFRRVIAVDPWNISASYKLGVVEQRYGNWSEAMKYYKKVYQQDPGYENAASYYNQLERMHGDVFTSRVGLVASPSVIATSGRLAYSKDFNSFIGLDVEYELKQQLKYPKFSDESQEDFQMHLISAELPLSFGASGLSLSPNIGLYFENLLYKTVYYPREDRAVTLGGFFGSMSTFPKFGVSGSWSWNYLSMDLSWENSIEAETLYAERAIMRKNDFELNMNTWFNIEDSDLMGPLTTRTYGRLQVMDDENLKGQVYQDLMLGFNLYSNPVIRLSPGASVSFEHSKDVTAVDYYAPNRVLEAKGSLRSSFIFPSSDWSSAFEAVLWGAGGGYWSNLGLTSLSTSAKAEGGFGATWVKNGSQYYLNMNIAKTFPVTGDDYWELSAVLGTSLSQPGLLAP